MKLPRRGSISAEELLLPSFPGPALFCQEYALFFANWPAPKCPKQGQLGRKSGSLLSMLKYSQCLQKLRGFYSLFKSPFWWDQKAVGHLSLQREGRLSEVCRDMWKCRQSTPSRGLKTRAKNKTKQKKTQTKKPSPEQPGLISQLTALGAGGLARGPFQLQP